MSNDKELDQIGRTNAKLSSNTMKYCQKFGILSHFVEQYRALVYLRDLQKMLKWVDFT